MRDIIIISPDPETSRALELKFELEGFNPQTFVDMKELSRSITPSSKCTFILDMLSTSSEQLSEVRDLMKFAGSKRENKTAIILPRGLSELNEKKMNIKPDLTIRKPYEIGYLVKVVGEISRSLGFGIDES